MALGSLPNSRGPAGIQPLGRYEYACTRIPRQEYAQATRETRRPSVRRAGSWHRTAIKRVGFVFFTAGLHSTFQKEKIACPCLVA